MMTEWRRRLREEWFLLLLLLALPVLLVASPTPFKPTLDTAWRAIDWDTLGTLARLMVLSRSLESSGYLAVAGQQLLSWARSERALAMLLVGFAALLSAVVTNDIALFIVVPLTLALAGRGAKAEPDGPASGLPIGRLIIFEALAVNAGSALSPIGNPQNILLWQTAGMTFMDFTRAMGPLAVVSRASILLLVPLAFRRRALVIPDQEGALIQRSSSLAAYCGILFVGFVIASDQGLALPAGMVIVLAFAWQMRTVLARVDWLLLPVFALMFIDLGLLAHLPAVVGLADLDAGSPSLQVSAGILTSQAISNVPAAILLNSFTTHWVALAWGVNIGGFGLAIGSMANLIALHLARQTTDTATLWTDFHRWSVPMLGGVWLAAILLID